MAQHPLGIQPEGQLLLHGGDMRVRTEGLGSLARLSDALVLEVCGHLGARDLSMASQASKALYCFCNTEDLWKAHVLEDFGGDFTWDTQGRSWHAAYAASCAAAKAASAAPAAVPTAPTAPAAPSTAGCSQRPSKRARQGRAAPGSAAAGGRGGAGGGPEAGVPGGSARGRLRVRGFYSNLLHQPWHCATAELQPEWLEVDNVDRRRGLSAAEFRAQYEARNRPVVLEDGAASWPALRKWSMAHLQAAFGQQRVVAGGVGVPFATYAAYAATTVDEMPLYLFDCKFVGKAPGLAPDFAVPAVFEEDLFGVLGDARPDYRWLIVGPARSGSSFHVDPNATSAWNAVVAGSKKWILFPPGCVPPGVHPSADGADVAAPVSVMEWFLNFYAAAREAKVPPLECIVRQGEVMFVPRGWWHCCLNLESMTIAVTQNFVSSANVCEVLRFIKSNRADLISGCAMEDRATLHSRFVAALKQHAPEIMRKVEEAEAARKEQQQREAKLASLFSTGKGGGSGGGGGAGQAARGEGAARGRGARPKELPAAEDEGARSAAAAPAFSFNFAL